MSILETIAAETRAEAGELAENYRAAVARIAAGEDAADDDADTIKRMMLSTRITLDDVRNDAEAVRRERELRRQIRTDEQLVELRAGFQKSVKNAEEAARTFLLTILNDCPLEVLASTFAVASAAVARGNAELSRQHDELYRDFVVRVQDARQLVADLDVRNQQLAYQLETLRRGNQRALGEYKPDPDLWQGRSSVQAIGPSVAYAGSFISSASAA
jgi:hypothetical protein